MTAYFGPNSALIGNIGNSYWQYASVKNVAESIKFVFVFMFVDLGSLVIGSIVLWKKCRINLYRAFSALQKEFTGVFAASLAIAFNAVSIISLLINVYVSVNFIFEHVINCANRDHTYLFFSTLL